MENVKNALNFSLTRKTGADFLQLTMIAEECSVLIRFMSIYNEKPFTYKSQGVYV